MSDDYSPHIYINGKRIYMGRGIDGLWVPQFERTNKSRVQPVISKNGDEEDASRIMGLLRGGEAPLYRIGARLGMGFRRAERLLNLLLAKGDVEVERKGHGQQWRLTTGRCET